MGKGKPSRRRQTGNRKSATCAAIFVRFPLESLPYTSERPGGSCSPTSERVQILDEMPKHFIETVRLLAGDASLIDGLNELLLQEEVQHHHRRHRKHGTRHLDGVVQLVGGRGRLGMGGVDSVVAVLELVQLQHQGRQTSVAGIARTQVGTNQVNLVPIPDEGEERYHHDGHRAQRHCDLKVGLDVARTIDLRRLDKALRGLTVEVVEDQDAQAALVQDWPSSFS